VSAFKALPRPAVNPQEKNRICLDMDDNGTGAHR
jgi:hypothetical protein